MSNMATKKKPGQEVAVAKQGGALAIDVPDYLKGYTGRTGTEGIDSSDVTIPRVKLGQSMSEEVKDGSVKEGALFGNVTKQLFAEPGVTLPFVTLWRGKEYILWRPRKDNGGGILARAKLVLDNGVKRYKWDKPNTEFEVKVEGKTKVVWKTKNFIDEDGLDQWGSEIPGQDDSGIAATAHHNYIVVLPTFDEMVTALSLSKSSAKKAKDFNALLKLGGNIPMWARQFTVKSIDDQKDSDKFKNYAFANDGFVPADAFKRYERMAEGFAGKDISVDHSDGDDDASDTKGNKPL
jgi:hypothetical protein